jgi:hypothetical protein
MKVIIHQCGERMCTVSPKKKDKKRKRKSNTEAEAARQKDRT